jgi:hypothetical protein
VNLEKEDALVHLIVVKYELSMICARDYDPLLLLWKRLMVGRESALRRDEDGKKTLCGRVR